MYYLTLKAAADFFCFRY